MVVVLALTREEHVTERFSIETHTEYQCRSVRYEQRTIILVPGTHLERVINGVMSVVLCERSELGRQVLVECLLPYLAHAHCPDLVCLGRKMDGDGVLVKTLST